MGEAPGGKRIVAPSGFAFPMIRTHHLFKPVMIGGISAGGRILRVSVIESPCPPIGGAYGAIGASRPIHAVAAAGALTPRCAPRIAPLRA